VFLLDSTAADCGTEDVGVLPVVIPKLKLSNVQMQIFFANLMVRPDNTALQDRPETFDGVRMNCADDVLTDAVVNNAVVEAVVQAIVARPSVGAEQAGRF
jgi:hypothetical protein